MLKLYAPPKQISEDQEKVILDFLEVRVAKLAAKVLNETVEFVLKEKRRPSEEEMEMILKGVLK